MALKLGELVAHLKADDSKFEKGLAEAKKKFEGFGDKMKIAGAAVGVALMAGVVSAMNIDSANDKLAAQLGLTGPESARIGKIAGDLYANAYGESIGQVNEAIRGVTQNIEGMATANDADLQNVTASVIDLATAFDADLGQTTRAVGKLIKTGLAADAGEALDLLTRGFQTGTDEAGDLLDTVSEYSTKFRDIGLSGQQAMGLLSQGLQAGARDADTVADALKEFAIRAVDGSTLTADGFKAIGLNGDKMAKIFAKGGPEAAAALDTVLDRLRGMKNPVERDAAAVALFGTKAEDLGDALFALDPSSAVAALGDVEGAAGKMGTTLADNAASRLESFKRKAQQALVNGLGAAIPTIEKVVAWVKDKLVPAFIDGYHTIEPALKAVAGFITGTLLPAVVDLASWLNKHRDVLLALAIAIGVALVPAFISWAISAGAAAVATIAATLPILAVIAVIALLVFGIIQLVKHWDTIWAHIKDAAQAVGNWFAGPFAGFFVNLWNVIVSGVVNAKNWVVNTFNTLVGFVTGLPGRMWGAARGLWDGLKDSFRSAINWLIDRWNNFSLTLGGGSVLGMDIPSVTLNTPDIPRLAGGGIVPATPGGRLLVAGEGGEAEAVAPLSKLADMIRDAIREAGGGPDHLTVVADFGQGFTERVEYDLRRRDRRLVRRIDAGTGRR